MEVSIIVTIYNLQKYIELCVNSIINQTLKDIEIILVDDGSTDNSGNMCDEYAKMDSRIKVVHKPNGGLVSARKAGLKFATSDYVAYVDGDDWVDPEAFEKMYHRLIQDGSEIVKYGHYETTGNVEKVIFHNIEPGVYDKKKLLEVFYPNMIAGEDFFEWKVFPSLCDMLISRELLEKEQYLVEDSISLNEDAACMFPLMLRAHRLSIVNEAYYHYVQHSESMMKTLPSKEELRQSYARLNDYLYARLVDLSSIYDVTDQWIDCILFSMIPRATLLYDGIDELDYVFPFKNIPLNSKVALYCAGTFGQLLYKYLSDSGCCDVVIWCDRNYEALSKQGLPVVSPEMLLEKEYDRIIVASMFAKDRKAILNYLNGLKLNVEIGVIDPDFVRSDEVKRGFRLI